MKGDINTMKWQVGILLTAVVGVGGTVVGTVGAFCVCLFRVMFAR